MSLHKPIDFARLCGVRRSTISVNIKRKNLVLNKNKMIDDSNPVNKIYMDRMLSKKGKEPAKVSKENESTAELPPASNTPKKDLLSLDKEKKALDIKKIKEEIDLLKIKKAKQEGENIPTVVVKSAFSQHFKSVTTAFKNASNRLVTEISKRKGLTKKEQAEITGKLYFFINEAISEAIEDSKSSIDLIIQEYSEKRGVGERK
jgi:hypothetical protein